MNELRSAWVVAPVLFVLACGGTEANVVISQVDAAPVSAGAYKGGAVTASKHKHDMEVFFALDGENECQSVGLLACDLETPGPLTPPNPTGGVCDPESAQFDPRGVSVDFIDICHDQWQQWRSTTGTGHVTRHDDEVRITLSGPMHGLATTPGTFELGVDVVFSADDTQRN